MKYNLKIIFALILSAASSLIYEVVATNVLLFYFVRSSYSIATVLSVFLFGLGLGSFLIYKFSKKIKNPQNLFGILQILIGLYAFFVFGKLTQTAPILTNGGLIISSFATLFLPTLFLGASFPLASMAFKNQKKDIIGLVYFIDIIGSVAGTLVSGFWLIPSFGNTNTILIAVGLNFLSATIILPKIKKFFSISFFSSMLFFICKSSDRNFQDFSLFHWYNLYFVLKMH